MAGDVFLRVEAEPLQHALAGVGTGLGLGYLAVLLGHSGLEGRDLVAQGLDLVGHLRGGRVALGGVRLPHRLNLGLDLGDFLVLGGQIGVLLADRFLEGLGGLGGLLLGGGELLLGVLASRHWSETAAASCVMTTVSGWLLASATAGWPFDLGMFATAAWIDPWALRTTSSAGAAWPVIVLARLSRCWIASSNAPMPVERALSLRRSLPDPAATPR